MAQARRTLRIFISYGHDEHATLAQRLKEDLQARGHETWFDLDRLRAGVDWEAYIEDGLEWVASDRGVGRFVLLMTPHSVRRPDGFCLRELTRAQQRGLQIVPVMVVSCEPPISICHLQWLDMQDCVPVEEREERYQAKFHRLLEALEENRLDFEATQTRLSNFLRPLPFEADIAQHLDRFTGRKWVFDHIDAWLAHPDASRVFWIVGKPGVGKTAIAAWLCRHRREIAAFHLCRHGHTQKADPRRAILSIAYQLSSQLPDYQEGLRALNLEELAAESNAPTLFDGLIVQPLSGNFPEPDRTIVVLIDALDEATRARRNELASFIGSEWDKTPAWLRLIITSRPEPEVTQPLQRLEPYVLRADAPENLADIRKYLKRELAAFAEGAEVPASAIDAIVERSEGLFLYVDWVRQELASGRLSLDRVDDFPQGLGGVYAQFFQRQIPDITVYENTVRPVLELVAAAREPLELGMIRSLLGWEEYAEQELRPLLGSLFPIADGTIQPFHQSVMDWLTDGDTAGSYFVSAREGHRRLAEYGWRQYRDGTENLPPYMLAHLPAHLLAAGRRDDLERLLLDFDWLQAVLDATDPNVLLSHFDLLPEHHGLRLVQSAIRLSANPLARDTTQLPSQVCGRLLAHERSDIRALLSQVQAETHSPWFRPLAPALAQAGGPLLRTLEGHGGYVRAVAVSPGSRRAISGSDDGTVRVWDLESGELRRTLEGHGGAVNAVAVTPDGRRAISGSLDSTVKVWDLESGELRRTLEGHGGAVNAVAVTRDGRQAISGSDDGTVKVWDLESGELRRTLEGHGGYVVAVAVSPGGRRAISGSDDGTVKVWDLESGELRRTLEGHGGYVRAVAVAPDGRRAISGSLDSTVRVWDLESGELRRTLEGHTDWVMAVAVTQDGRRVISGSDDGTVKVWDLESGELRRTLEGHGGSVRAVAVSPGGRRAISGSSDGTVKVWDLESGELLRTLEGHGGSVWAVAVTPDGGRGISGSSDRTVKVWDLESGELLLTLEGHGGSVWAVAVTRDGRRAISGSEDSTVKVWDLESGEQLRALEGHTGWVLAVAVTVGARRAISGSRDSTVRVWDLESGEQLRVLEGHTGWVEAVAVTPDGRHAISGSRDNTARVWDLESGELGRTLEGHGGSVRAVAVSPGGRRAISSSDDGTVKVWDLESGEQLCTFTADAGVNACAVTPDGRTILAGDAAGRVHFLRLEGV